MSTSPYTFLQPGSCGIPSWTTTDVLVNDRINGWDVLLAKGLQQNDDGQTPSTEFMLLATANEEALPAAATIKVPTNVVKVTAGSTVVLSARCSSEQECKGTLSSLFPGK